MTVASTIIRDLGVTPREKCRGIGVKGDSGAVEQASRLLVAANASAHKRDACATGPFQVFSLSGSDLQYPLTRFILDTAIYALDAFAIQAKGLVEPAELHAVEAGVEAGHPYQQIDVAFHFFADFAAHESPEGEQPAARPERPPGFRVGERRDARVRVVHG